MKTTKTGQRKPLGLRKHTQIAWCMIKNLQGYEQTIGVQKNIFTKTSTDRYTEPYHLTN